MATGENEIARLIEFVFRDAYSTDEGRSATRRLAELGRPAFEAFLAALKKPHSSSRHPRDIADAVQDVFCEFACTDPGLVLDALDAGRLPDRSTAYWAFGYAEDERSIDVLIAGLKDRNRFARWAAAESLIRRGSERAVPALVAALRDRSTLVKSVIVSAMKDRGAFRRPEAVPSLKRIIDSSAVAKHSPGLRLETLEVLELMAADRSH